MTTGYCTKGPATCSCVGMFREGRDKGTCRYWTTPEQAAAREKVAAGILMTSTDIDDLLVRKKLTREMKRKLLDAKDYIEMEKAKL